MNKNDADVFVFQILVSNLSLLKPPKLNNYEDKAISPVINIKIQDGPNVFIPFLSQESIEKHLENVRKGHKHPPIEVEESIMKGGVFDFDKGKSCLFTTHVIKRQNIKIQIEVSDGLVFPPSIAASSEVLERTFDSDSLHIQTLIKEKVTLFDNKSKFGFLSLIVTLQSIGSFHSSSENSDEKVLGKKRMKTKAISLQECNCGDKNSYRLSSNENSLRSEYYFSEDPSDRVFEKQAPSAVKVKNDVIGTGRKDDHQPHKGHNDRTSKFSRDAGTPLARERNKILNLKLSSISSVKKEKRSQKPKQTISPNDRPTGWLRSTPVYKGNISMSPTPSQTTRTTFFRLYRMYPDIQNHLHNEVQRQIKEKANYLDRRFDEEIYRQKSKYLRPRVCSVETAGAQLTSQNSRQINRINVALQTQESHENKETLVGRSLLEVSSPPSTPTFEDYVNEFEEKASVTLSDTSMDNSTKNEQLKPVDENEKQTFQFKSSNARNFNIRKKSLNDHENITNLKKQSGVRYNLARTDNYQSVSDSSFQEDKGEPSKEVGSTSNKAPQFTMTGQKTPPSLAGSNAQAHTNMDLSPSAGSLERKGKLCSKSLLDSDFNAQNLSPTAKTPANVLVHESSKTSSSIYPQSSEDRPHGKTLPAVPQSPRGLDDIESTVSDISEKIGKLLVPMKNEFPSIHTDSISSFVPSGLSDGYSSLSDL